MVNSTVSLPVKWEQFLKQLADDHQVDLNSVISELCAWTFSNPEGKKQFEAWLDEAFPPKGEAEDKERSVDEEISEGEEEKEGESANPNKTRLRNARFGLSKSCSVKDFYQN